MKKNINNEHLKNIFLTLSLFSLSALHVSSANTEDYNNIEKRVTSLSEATQRKDNSYEEQLTKKPNVKIHMTTNQVLNETNWGKPDRINRPINAYSAYGDLEQWIYGTKNSLYFTNDKVTSINESTDSSGYYTSDFNNYIVNDFSMTKKLAEKGYPEAQSMMGFHYQQGFEVPHSDTEAFNWYYKSANKGHISGQYYLGTAYSNGIGVGVDKRQAFKWFEKAAEQNDRASQWIMWGLYKRGIGVQQDLKKANEWYERASNPETN